MKLPKELMFLTNRNAPQKTSTASMKDKVVVLTGATSGVGLQTMKQLAKGHAHIVMVVRSRNKAESVKAEIEEINRVAIDIVTADFNDLEQVREAAGYILNHYPKIDVLINCAGMHSTKVKYTKEGFEQVFCVNHLAPFLFSHLLLERLKESAPSRILQINSEGHRFNGLDINDIHWKKRIYTGLRGYGASKTAQLLTVWEIHEQLKDSGVTINAMHPGDVKTNIGQNNGLFYRLFSKYFISLILKDPKISGEAIYYLVADKEMDEVSGKFFHLTIEEIPANHALDKDLQKEIYALSMQLTGLSD